MSFLRPFLLWFGLLPVLLLIGYWLLQRRCRVADPRRALMLQRAGARTSGWRRHLAPLLLLAACGVLVVTLAGPTVMLTLASEQQTLVLALDASGSMEARDIAPNRLQASQAAAKALVRSLPRRVRVGVVSYADTPQLVQPPTLQHDDVLAAIDRVRLAGGTAIGDAILLSLATLFPGPGSGNAAASAAFGRGHGEATPERPGSYRSAAIVLLTDGQNSSGVNPLEAARIVAARGVKVYAIGFGTQNGVLVGPENTAVQVGLDEETLQGIASTTGGEYFHAASGTELRQIYAGLQSRLVVGREETEVSALFAAAAALLIVAGAGLSLCWFGRIA